MKSLSQVLPNIENLSKPLEQKSPMQPHGSTNADGRLITQQLSQLNPLSLPATAELPPPLPPSIEREVYIAMTASHQSAERLSLEPETTELLKTEIKRLNMILIPATRSEIQRSLARLILHCPMQTMNEMEQAELFSDYISDLEIYPVEMIRGACEKYRLDPANRFFPRSGMLVSMVRIQWQPLDKKLKTIQQLLKDIKQPKADLERITPQAWDDLNKAIAAVPDPATQKYDRIFVPDKTYFDNKKQRQLDINPLTGDVYENAGQ